MCVWVGVCVCVCVCCMSRRMQQRVVRYIDARHYDLAHRAREELLDYIEVCVGLSFSLSLSLSPSFLVCVCVRNIWSPIGHRDRLHGLCLCVCMCFVEKRAHMQTR